MSSAPGEIIRQLSEDFLTVQNLLETNDGVTRAGYCRVASQLAVITARTWSGLAHHGRARRWWRTARYTADESGDPRMRALARGAEVVTGLYENRPEHVLLAIADQGVSLGGDVACRGTAGLWSGLAQVNARLGRERDAIAALRRMEGVTERLPDVVLNSTTTYFGWPEYRLRHAESYVYSHLGDFRRAYAAQDAAFDLYGEERHAARERAQVEMHRARCLVADGDVAGGIAHATRTLTGLPAEFRASNGVKVNGRMVLRSLPPAEHGRSDVTTLIEALEC